MASGGGGGGQKPIRTEDIDATHQQVNKAQQQADDVSNAMKKNITKMYDRGDKLNDLSAKTTDLTDTSRNFRSTAKKAKRKAFWNNLKWMILLLFLFILIGVFVMRDYIIGRIFPPGS